MTKSCNNPSCPQVNPQPLTEFCKELGTSDNLRRRCKTCCSLTDHKGHKKHKQERLKARRSYRESNREKIRDSQKASARRPKRRFEQAKRRGVHKWELTLDQWYSIVIDQVCHYCDGPLPETGSALDRKDNDGDYTITNVVPCCQVCNQIKGDVLTYLEMLAVAALLKQMRKQPAQCKDEPTHDITQVMTNTPNESSSVVDQLTSLMDYLKKQDLENKSKSFSVGMANPDLTDIYPTYAYMFNSQIQEAFAKPLARELEPERNKLIDGEVSFKNPAVFVRVRDKCVFLAYRALGQRNIYKAVQKIADALNPFGEKGHIINALVRLSMFESYSDIANSDGTFFVMCYPIMDQESAKLAEGLGLFCKEGCLPPVITDAD